MPFLPAATRLSAILSLLAALACDEATTPQPHIGLVTERAESPLDETDAPAVLRVVRDDGRKVAERARDATSSGDIVYTVLESGALVADADGKRRVLLEGVTRGIAVLPDGSVVAPRAGDEPGETDLWLVPNEGAPRPLAPAPGPDDKPIALPDGRVAFVSGRTTIASLWIADVETGEARQLTNRGLVAGKPLEGFVPPPDRDVEVVGGALVYDAGGGERWQVDLETGRGARLGASDGVHTPRIDGASDGAGTPPRNGAEEVRP